MRFAKGCKVEVFSKREVPTGSWRPAEILNGDGHNYTVRCDRFANEPVIGWVSSEAIRPRPPLELCNWTSGETVEVFDNFSWKVATILKGLGNKKILVHLHGSLVNRIVNLYEIRVRHSWKHGKWIVIGKSSWEYSAGQSRKYRHVEKEGQTHRVIGNLSAEHVLAYGEKRGQSSLVIRFPVRQQRSESSNSIDSFSSVRADSTDLCSIGSCSSTDSWSQFTYNGPIADSDAESSCTPSHDESPEKATAAAAMHQLELEGYRCTLRALHASGPLSWEQQSLISNLRLTLNISNDEHLMELKTLLSR